MTLILRFATSLVRTWSRMYTWRMPTDVAESRCAELESDLWELQHDPDGGRGLTAATQVIGRLMLGVPDDLAWRAEHAADGGLVLRRAVSLTAAASILSILFIAFWIIPAWIGQGDELRQTRVVQCANESTAPETTPELRMRVIKCAGAFFGSRVK